MRIAVTGAFGYSGRYITNRLLEAGHQVINLTNSPHRPNPFGDRVRAFPLRFDEPGKLRESLQGIDTLVNTYWVRFDHRLFTHRQAVANTRVLFSAANEAGLRRIVHVSITNPDPNSDLPYFRGKAELEIALRGLALSHAILRPTVLFGKEDILINNIAWAVRHLPVVGVFGSGDYRLQPICVEDFAQAAARLVTGDDNRTVEAIGPETFTYRELLTRVAEAVGLRRRIVAVPPALGFWCCRLIGLLMNDVVITREEIRGLMEGRLHVQAPPLGTTRLTEWMHHHRDTLGRTYASELARRTRPAGRGTRSGRIL